MMSNNDYLIINMCHIKYTVSYTWMYLSLFHFENFVYNNILGNQNHNYGTFTVPPIDIKLTHFLLFSYATFSIVSMQKKKSKNVAIIWTHHCNSFG
jgi:hypothetical protein